MTTLGLRFLGSIYLSIENYEDRSYYVDRFGCIDWLFIDRNADL